MGKIKERFKKPTPKKAKLVGETIQDIGIIVAMFAPMVTSPWVSVAAGILGKLGKIVSRLAVEK